MKRFFSLVLALGLSLSLALPSSALEVQEARALLEYYHIDGLPEGAEKIDSVKGLIDALGDPYTTYLSASEYSELLTSINGDNVVGIGVTIQTVFENGYPILSVLPNSPAQQAHLQPGDVVLAVDGTTLTADIYPADLIRGEVDTPVTLTIFRPDSGDTFSITLTRQIVNIPLVTYKMVDDALVMFCDSFGQSTAQTVAEALRLHQEQASVCIMDLRSNPGGTSSAAANSAGAFLGQAPITYFRNASDKYSVVTSSSTPDLTDKPLIILTSGESASGSELFSAAIRDYNAGIAIGQRTYGKGVAQYLFDETTYPELFDGDCMKITIYRFFSPDGATNDIIGILPTLLLAPEHTDGAALLLSAPAPQHSNGYLRLELAGQTFFIRLEQALDQEYLPSFAALLEALPPSARLELGSEDTWIEITPSALAERMSVTITPRTFSDVQDNPYLREIHTLSSYQLINGYGDGTFRPEQSITRGEFCAMLASALNLPETNSSGVFTDIAEDAWYASSVSAMAAKGFISGFEDGTFRPNSFITYEEVVCVLNNVATWASMDGFSYASRTMSESDKDSLQHYSSWAQLSARNLKLMESLLPDVSPTAPASRGEAAATLCRLMEYCTLLWN